MITQREHTVQAEQRMWWCAEWFMQKCPQPPLFRYGSKIHAAPPPCVIFSLSTSQQTTCTSTGLILTRLMYNLTAGVLLVIRIWWWCMGRIKCKCGVPERPSLMCSHSPAGLPRFYVNEANQRPASGFTAAIMNLSSLIWGIRDEGVSAARA